jgi:hypothetical protein
MQMTLRVAAIQRSQSLERMKQIHQVNPGTPSRKMIITTVRLQDLELGKRYESSSGSDFSCMLLFSNALPHTRCMAYNLDALSQAKDTPADEPPEDLEQQKRATA